MENLKNVDLYKLFSVEPDADVASIKKAYRKALLTCHPDKNPNDKKAAKKFRHLNEALKLLTDAESRKAYDDLRKKRSKDLKYLLNADKSDKKSDYEIVKELGRGSFGSVVHAIKNGNNYAIKKVENTCPTAKSEMEVLKTVNHHYIIKYYGHFWDEMKICIVLEYADMGTLENSVRAGGVEEYNVWRLICHISSALAYLHAMKPRPILHRDLKPDNILGVTGWSLPENGYRISWKLADFGIAKLLTKETQQAYYTAGYQGVPTYMAPEVWRDYRDYSDKSDVWALGCLMAFSLNGQHLFYQDVEVLRYSGGEILDKKVCKKWRYSNDLITVIQRMVSPLEKARQTAKEVEEETYKNDRQEVGMHCD